MSSSIPRTLNKRQLAYALGLTYSKATRVYYGKLRASYLTDDLLEKINIDPATYPSISNFTRAQTKKLIKELELEEEDFL